MVLQQEAVTPLYQQIVEDMRDVLERNVYKYGDKIPSEQDLIQKYQVSRITVRKAVDELCEQGYLVRKQGKGTFVAKPKIRRKIVNVLSFNDACRNSGMVPSYEVLEKKIVQASPVDIDFLQLKGDKQLIYTQRILKADDDPIMLENMYYPHDRYGFILEENLRSSLFQLLARYNLVPSETASCTLEMVRANESNAKLLNVPVGEPLFYMVSHYISKDNQPLHIGCNYIVASRYVFNIP